MTDFQDPSLLDYARFHGIAIDHQSITPLDQVPQPHESLNDTLADPPDVPIINPSKLHCDLEQELRSEKLEIPKDAARFLSSVIQAASRKSIDIDWDSFLPDRHRIRKLKLDLPVIKRNFDLNASPARAERIALDPIQLQLPREEVEDEHDEGLVFPKEYGDLSDGIWKEVSTERLDCSREDLELLQKVTRVKEPDNDYIIDEILEIGVGVKGRSLRDLSPIILHERIDSSPCMMSQLVQSVPSFQSAKTTKNITDAVKESHIEEHGTTEQLNPENEVLETEIQKHAAKSPNTYSDHLTDVNGREDDNANCVQGTPSEPLSSGKPLTEQHNYEEADSGSSSAQHYIQDPHLDDPLSEPNTAGEMLDDYIDRFSVHAVESLDASTKQFVDANTADNILSSISLPLHEREMNGTSDREDADTPPTSLVNENVGQANLHEAENSDFPGVPVSDSQSLFCDSLISTNIITDNDIPSDGCANPVIGSSSTETITPNKSIAGVVDKTPYISCDQDHVKENPSEILRKLAGSLSCSAFSALGSLSSFMKIRGVTPKRQKTEQSPYFPTATLDNNPLVGSDLTREPQEDCTSHKPHGKLNITLPDTPPTALVTRSLTFVLSTSLLKTHRNIVTFLETLTPAPTLIFRDYESPGPSKSYAPNRNSSVVLPEADIIISPTTGIILTTTQATTQLYLPGHKHQASIDGFPPFDSPLRERMARLSLRYDDIYVLVCHAPSNTMGLDTTSPTLTMDPKTLSSVQSLISFCASLSDHSSIIPLVVPSAQNAILEWIITLANKHTYSFKTLKETNIEFTPINLPKYQPSFESIHEETHCELFLRRAGLNPFAALAVLDFLEWRESSESVDRPRSVNEDRCSSRWLSTFIEMDPDVRRKLFDTLIGRRAIKAIEHSIEREWHLEEWCLDF
ncbi:hypothetical protein DTO271G3_8449 [Paecilomyces variotii]|nr:hypothetical protein DTO271G3_8449 [Paecilomyces variotii]